MAELNDQISERQRAKIDKAFWENLEKVKDSDALTAMDNDVRLFGDEAFSRNSLNSDNER